MSIVRLQKDNSRSTHSRLRELSNIVKVQALLSIPPMMLLPVTIIRIVVKTDEEAYLLVLLSADVTTANVNNLPDYVDLAYSSSTVEEECIGNPNKQPQAWSHQAGMWC